MFCPGCNAYLTERDVIKTSVKYAPGNVPIEYEARCPSCSCEMGKVSWGQLTINPDLAKTAVPVPAPAKNEPEPHARPMKRGFAPSNEKTCPHCGKPLPEDY